MMSMMGIVRDDDEEQDTTANDLPLSTIVDSSSDERLSTSSGSENTSFFFCYTHIVRKKRSGLSYVRSASPINHKNGLQEEHQDMMMINRRKGIPQRSPLY
ncbi:hypothetical protein QQ045_002593 [Rhodiola kirilowii]